MLFIIGGFIAFPQMERVSNVIQLQFMCGIRAYTYWLSTYLFDLVIYVLMILPILFVTFLYEHFATNSFGGCKELGKLFLKFF